MGNEQIVSFKFYMGVGASPLNTENAKLKDFVCYSVERIVSNINLAEFCWTKLWY